MKVTCEIPMRLPSLNEYIHKLNYSRFAGGQFKKDIEEDLCVFLSRLPKFEKPVRIAFTWVESNKKRDVDNIAAGKKFILDAMVKVGCLKDDNRNCVTGFTDTFEYGKETKVILEITEQ